MQAGEVHGIAAMVPEVAPVTSRVLQQQCASFNASVSLLASLSVSGGAAMNAQCESFGWPTSSRLRPACPTEMVASEVADILTWPSEVMSSALHSQNLGREIAHPTMGASSSTLVVVGHRGCGKNRILPQGEAPEPRSSIRENTITSFNLAARSGAQFVEFDVQVTKDGVPVIFHDDLIITDAADPGKFIGELTLAEFRAIGLQRDSSKVGQSLYRRCGDGTVVLWTEDVEDPMCTLAEAFAEVQPTVGFNIEVKFDDDGATSAAELHRVIDAVLEDVDQFANGRMVYFSSFHPDAARLIRQKMQKYPVFFLTDGGTYLYTDPRRNSIEAAIQVCREGGLQGIVSEVKAVLQHPASVALVKAEGLFFFTYGELNNVGEALLKQQSWGIDGVIVDHVLEMVRVARHMDAEPASPSSADSLGRRSVSVV